MSLSHAEYTEIMNGYDRLRREHYLTEQARKEHVYTEIPEIQAIDARIAHISIAKAKEMIFRKEEDASALSALKDEIYDLSMEKVNLLVIHGYPADYLDPIYACPDCKDTGYIGAEKCHCFTEKIRALLYGQSNLEEQIESQNFAAFRLDYYSDVPGEGGLSPRENMRRALKTCEDYLRTFSEKPGQNLLIYGSAGVGKTFLSHCIAERLLAAGKSVVYFSAYQLFEQLADYAFRRQRENADTPQFLLGQDLLIIDDLGTELNNAFVNSQLFLCVNERILNHKSTIINTNLSLEEISRAYSERVFSRLVESYRLVHIFGEDIRIKKAFSSLDERERE